MSNYSSIDQTMPASPSFTLSKYLTHTPNPPAHFIGRATAVQAIRQQFDASLKPLILSGIGGVGKTTLAQAYLHDYAAAYQHIAWISATVSTNIQEAVVQDIPSEFLNLQFTNERPAIRFEQIIKALIALSGPNLFILDNVNDPDDLKTTLNILKKWIPHPKNWHILITSRTHLSKLNLYKVDLLPLAIAKQLFYTHYTYQKDNEHLTKALQLIDCHTLTIEILAKNLQRLGNRYSIQQLAEELETRGVLNCAQKMRMQGVYIPYNNFRKKLKIYQLLPYVFDIEYLLNDTERYVLLQFSVLPSKTIPLADWIDFLQLEKQEKQRELAQQLTVLVEKGWLQWEKKGYKMHTVIQEVVRKRMKPNTIKCANLITFFKQKLEHITPENVYIESRYVVCSKAIVQHIKEKTLPIADLLNNLSLTQYYCEYNTNAINYQKQGIYIQEQLLPPTHLKLAIAYSNLSAYYLHMEQLDQALHYQTKSLNIKKSHFEPYHTELARCYNNISAIYFRLGNYQKALFFQKKALAIRVQNESTGLNKIADSYDMLSIIYSYLGNLDEALKHAQKSIQLMQDLYDKNHPDLARAYNNISNIYFRLDIKEEAAHFQECAITINKQILPNSHQHLGISYSNLSSIYVELKQFDKALFYIKNALEIFQKSATEKSIHLAKCYRTYSKINEALGDLRQALDLLRHSLALYKQIYPDDSHPYIGKIYLNLSRLYLKLQNQQKAINFAENALNIYENNCEQLHSQIQEVRAWLHEINESKL